MRKLDLGDVDALFTEIICRTAPGPVTSIPSLLAQLLVLATEAEDVSVAKSKCKQFFDCSDVVLVPLYAGGHWTLLVFERSSPSVNIAQRRAVREEMFDEPEPLNQDGSIGCGSCRYGDTGCQLCEKVKCHKHMKKLYEAEVANTNGRISIMNIQVIHLLFCFLYYEALGQIASAQ